jgi:DUF1680 family protein
MPAALALPLHVPPRVTLSGGLFMDRFRLNRNYVASLSVENLLQNFDLEAGRRQWSERNSYNGGMSRGDERHWGWEAPTCQVRGHFVGHWLSAAARIWRQTGDAEIKGKADAVVDELEKCQAKNGGEWCSPIPETYMLWLAKGTPTWAPQYVHHKTLMGLIDMHRYAGNAKALGIADRLADWFVRWSAGCSREQLDRILDVETGGMLESWADLYASTGAAKYRDLIERYTRHRLFDPLLAGRDPLTNMHANTTIPEVHGAARCYEVTGDERWRRIVEAYWRCAVTARGTFCTGSQTAGEIWTPPFEFAARRGDKNQEHCVVYNLIRLADYLFRWTGAAEFADYIERNLYNGILAQQHPGTGQITYWLPLDAGAHKRWGHPTCDFWCCHGSLVQAHSLYADLIGYEHDGGLTLAQYIPATVQAHLQGTDVTLRLDLDQRNSGSASDNSSAAGARHRPTALTVVIAVSATTPLEFTLNLRLPEWLAGKAELEVNGVPVPVQGLAGSFEPLRRLWHNDTVRLTLPKTITAAPIPDEPGTMAFLDGPVVLAGLCDHEVTLIGDPERPATLLTADNEREWGRWMNGYRSVGQATTIRFKPLYEVVDEAYTLYFPVRRPG